MVAVFLRRLVTTRHSHPRITRTNINDSSSLHSKSQRCISNSAYAQRPENSSLSSGSRSFESFRDKRAARVRQSNAMTGWLIAVVAAAGGTLSAVVMAYAEGAQATSSAQRHAGSVGMSMPRANNMEDNDRHGDYDLFAQHLSLASQSHGRSKRTSLGDGASQR